jgi:predicted membrane-bound mannosyltransferase
VYFALPYKTPWCALGILHGTILLAGIGGVVLFRSAPGRMAKSLVLVFLAAAASHLGWQAWRASFVEFDDPRVPYVYAHTTRDLLDLVGQIDRIAEAHADGKSIHIQVVCAKDDYWPLPWYLREYSRVGWYSQAPTGAPAPVVVSHSAMEPLIQDFFYERQPPGKRHLYVPVGPPEEDRDWRLRPDVTLRVYVRLDLWNAYRGPGQLDGPTHGE